MHRILHGVVVAVLAAAMPYLAPGSGGPAALAAETSPGRAPVVVELFTSQGCNSCPPAEALLRELADEEGVIALELHVDYWDYIGWPDPFASPQITERQRSYASDLQLRYVYTPQMVIDGRVNVVGLNERRVRAAIKEAAARRKPLAVRIERRDGGRIVIPAGRAPAGGATVWLAVYDGYRETEVLRGENAGRTLKNANIVREFERLGVWSGERLEIPIDLDEAAAQGRAGCAVLVQQDQTGPILGATYMPIEIP